MPFNKYAAAAKSVPFGAEPERRSGCGPYDGSYYSGITGSCGGFTGGNGSRCNFGENIVAAGAALGGAWLLNKFLSNSDAKLANFYAKENSLKQAECALLCAQCVAYGTGYSNIYVWRLLTAGGSPDGTIDGNEDVRFSLNPTRSKASNPPLNAIVCRNGCGIRDEDGERLTRSTIKEYLQSSITLELRPKNISQNGTYASVFDYLVRLKDGGAGTSSNTSFNEFPGKTNATRDSTGGIGTKTEPLTNAEVEEMTNWVLAGTKTAYAYNEYLDALDTLYKNSTGTGVTNNICCAAAICKRMVRNANAVADLNELDNVIIVLELLINEIRRLLPLYFSDKNLEESWFKWIIEANTYLTTSVTAAVRLAGIDPQVNFVSAFGGEAACSGLGLARLVTAFDEGVTGKAFNAGKAEILETFTIWDQLADYDDTTFARPPSEGRDLIATVLGKAYQGLYVKDQIAAGLWNIQFAFCILNVCSAEDTSKMPAVSGGADPKKFDCSDFPAFPRSS